MSSDPLPGPAGGWTVGRIAIAVIIVAALIAAVYVILDVLGVPIPSWVIHLVWIVIVAFVGVLVVKLLIKLWSTMIIIFALIINQGVCHEAGARSERCSAESSQSVTSK